MIQVWFIHVVDVVFEIILCENITIVPLFVATVAQADGQTKAGNVKVDFLGHSAGMSRTALGWREGWRLPPAPYHTAYLRTAARPGTTRRSTPAHTCPRSLTPTSPHEGPFDHNFVQFRKV